MSRKIAVIGSGTWGTAACGLLAPHVDEVMLYARRESVAQGICETHRNPQHLPNLQLPHNVRATSSLEEAFAGATEAVWAVPSAFLRSTCVQARPYVDPNLPMLVLTKGIEPGTLYTMTQVIRDEMGIAACAMIGVDERCAIDENTKALYIFTIEEV